MPASLRVSVRIFAALVAAAFVFVLLRIVSGLESMFGISFVEKHETTPSGATVAHADAPYSQPAYYAEGYYQGYYQGYYPPIGEGCGCEGCGPC